MLPLATKPFETGVNFSMKESAPGGGGGGGTEFSDRRQKDSQIGGNPKQQNCIPENVPTCICLKGGTKGPAP